MSVAITLTVNGRQRIARIDASQVDTFLAHCAAKGRSVQVPPQTGDVDTKLAALEAKLTARLQTLERAVPKGVVSA